MFKDGFHNVVDIYFMNNGAENRTTKRNMFLSDEPDLQNVPCRINKDRKVIFDAKVKLLAGYVIKEVNTNMTYKVIRGNRVFGISKVHHSSYTIEIKAESDRIAR